MDKTLEELVFDSVPIGMVVGDPDGHVVRANPAFVEMTGFDQTELAEFHYRDLVHHEDLEQESEQFRKLIAGDQSSYTREDRMLTASGEYRWVRVLVTRLSSSETAELQDVLVAVLDIEERKALEREVAERRKLDAMAQLTGGLAHDFNNLLTVIRGEVELLAELVDRTDEAEGRLTTALEATDQAAVLTRKLLAFGRKQVLRTEVVSVNELLRSNEAMLRAGIPEDMTFKLELGNEVPTVEVDPGQLIQVVLNLLLNARDASSPGDIVRIRTYRRGNAGGECSAVVEVVDQGAGIAAAAMDRLFEPFYTTKETGTGLGLSTSYGIVRQSGGKLEVASTLGSGSVFSVSLPAATPPGSGNASDSAGARSEEVSGADVPVSGAVVLIIEDEGRVRSLMRHALEREGIRTLEAGTVGEAVRILDVVGKRLDLVLSDVVLPGSNEQDLWREIARKAPQAPVVLTSGYAKDVLEDKIPASAVRWFLEKPFTVDALAGIVREALSVAVVEGEAKGDD